mgnify:CR=1 FL=1|jgi:drug/metabolite transporter (DMT)-like permease
MSRVTLFGILFVLGSVWGVTIPLIKITVDAGYRPFGLIFWQLVIGALVMVALRLMQRKPMGLPLGKLWFFAVVALLGTVLPNTFSYAATFHLPAGVMAVTISMVPIFAFPIALAMGIDRFSWLRVIGLMAGIVGVVLLVGPESLPDASKVWWVPVALIAAISYAMEGNVVAKWGTHGFGPGHVLFGASVVGSGIALPVALGTGQFINPLQIPVWGLPEVAFIAASAVHVLVYSGYVWLVGRAGAVFAAQTAYVITGAGVFWSMLILNESYSTWVWLAMGLIMAGMTLVRPRDNTTLADGTAIGEADL